jgi:hypothetical protein
VSRLILDTRVPPGGKAPSLPGVGPPAHASRISVELVAGRWNGGRMSFDVPESVIKSVLGRPTSSVVDVTAGPLDGGTGAATAGPARLTVRVRGSRRGLEEFTLVRKVFRPLQAGRHKHGAEDLRHWTYWQREPLACASEVLSSGPGLMAPRCHGVFDSTIYLEDIEDQAADTSRDEWMPVFELMRVFVKLHGPDNVRLAVRPGPWR